MYPEKKRHKGLFTTLLEMREENDQLLSKHALTKVKVNIDTTNERGRKGRDLYFQVWARAVVLARHILIRVKPQNPFSHCYATG